MKVNGQWVPCVRNSSYSFIPILLKLYRCLNQALKICMWFGYDTQINFYYFCSQFELSHFSVILTMKVNGRGGGVPCVRNFFYSFILILLKLYSCLYNALKIRIWFAYNPQPNFYHFFAI